MDNEHPIDDGASRERKMKPDTGRKVKISSGIVSLALIAGFLLLQHMQSSHQADLTRLAFKRASTPAVVNVIRGQNAPSSFALTLPGETEAWYDSTIYSRVDGYVASWLVDIGHHVNKGQVLANIDTPTLDAELAAARAKVKASEALVVARQADANFAKTSYTRWKESPKGVVSEQEREAKKAACELAAAQLNQAKAQVGIDQALVDQYTARSRFKQVVAPYSGVITERHIDIGNLVSSSNTTPLYRLVKKSIIRVVVYVPQNSAGDIELGSDVRVETGNDESLTFYGKVARTADAINSQTRTLRVEADIPNPDHSLVPGMFVNVSFQVPTAGLVLVPAAALLFRSGGPEVGFIGDDNHIKFRRVKIKRDDGNIVELASGVSAGDRVALNISNRIADGAIVEPHEIVEFADVPHTEN